jgi:hypothetical protein
MRNLYTLQHYSHTFRTGFAVLPLSGYIKGPRYRLFPRPTEFAACSFRLGRVFSVSHGLFDPWGS